MITKDLGAVTAYAYAVEGGYTGTEEEFTQLMADLGITVDEFEHFSVSVSTLPAGSSATASYSNGVLSLGIPKGDKGDTGNTGATGATPQLSIGTVETTAQPSVTITGTAENPVLNFGLVKGDKGETGEVSEAELTQAFEDFSANGTVANAEQLTTDIRANDQTPYLFRTSGGSVDIGDREYINGIVGGTVAWNQLVTLPTSGAIPAGSGATLTYGADGATITISGATTATAYLQLQLIPKSINGHVYFARVNRSDATKKINLYNDGGGVNTASGSNYGEEIVGKATANNLWYLRIPSGESFAGTETVKPIIIDLTQMFGSTIADYIYSLEQATAGAGVAWIKSHGFLTKPYYAYNAGELMSVKGLVSHDMVGFNAWDEEWELGYYNVTTGEPATSSQNLRSKNFIPVVPNTSYYAKIPAGYIAICEYDADKNFIKCTQGIANSGITTTADTHFIRFHCTSAYGTTYNHDICINLSWDGSEDGNYEPYQKWSYSLDSDLELRGIPKIENGNLYYDGDVYGADGTVTRKYGVVDLGTLNWGYQASGTSVAPYMYTPATSLGIKRLGTFGTTIHNIMCAKYTTVARNADVFVDKTICADGDVNAVTQIQIKDSAYSDATAFKTAMSGVYLVYELATPTTETADPYTSPQIVSDFGTEEYVIDDDVFAIPVGHNTDYPVDLKAKLEMAPNSPPGDGMYVVKQTSGTNEYVPLIIPSGIPPVPTENGSYTLTATVSGGTTTLSWS